MNRQKATKRELAQHRTTEDAAIESIEINDANHWIKRVRECEALLYQGTDINTVTQKQAKIVAEMLRCVRSKKIDRNVAARVFKYVGFLVLAEATKIYERELSNGNSF